LKGKYPALKERLLSHQPDEIKIPAIVAAELFFGAHKSNQKERNIQMVKDFLFPFEIISFASNEIEIYGEIRADLEKSGNVIGPNDLIIAASTLANEATLVTNNTSEFQRVPNLKIENWIQ
jgi:tRNA(fMet)-specific endonuclease VapC